MLYTHTHTHTHTPTPFQCCADALSDAKCVLQSLAIDGVGIGPNALLAIARALVRRVCVCVCVSIVDCRLIFKHHLCYFLSLPPSHSISLHPSLSLIHHSTASERVSDASVTARMRPQDRSCAAILREVASVVVDVFGNNFDIVVDIIIIVVVVVVVIDQWLHVARAGH